LVIVDWPIPFRAAHEPPVLNRFSNPDRTKSAPMPSAGAPAGGYEVGVPMIPASRDPLATRQIRLAAHLDMDDAGIDRDIEVPTAILSGRAYRLLWT
jgi:hypothetical protein